MLAGRIIVLLLISLIFCDVPKITINYSAYGTALKFKLKGFEPFFCPKLNKIST